MISYNKNEKTFTLKTKQKLPITLLKSWNFFSSPKNLSKITPSHMNFKILTDFGKMYEGQIIKYRVSPFPFFRVGWTTKITSVEKPFSFTDKQISGPFSLWEHKHIFEETSKGIYAHDIIKYKLPLGLLGRLFGGKIIMWQLNKIFEFRKKILNKLFVK
jgi:ligand-binding SRPBCC domain-containing protein